MITAIEYALLAGASYISTRPDVNQFPVPDGWVENVIKRQSLPSGFEATYFTRGTGTSTEIVISFAGTNDKDYTGDIELKGSASQLISNHHATSPTH